MFKATNEEMNPPSRVGISGFMYLQCPLKATTNR